ncbi:TRAP transporter substrate-binding protein [Pseudohalocynthiibacter aestuariivivens]|uniref:TRAP transporter substrate-binding protein n=1 Tax=Roseovarius pelagicus TaxID=2980108 RepID=A0ABY6D8W1_9RHOB|nr:MULTISPECIES: TRAP transporter substrate-binding protein [Rhodobacterales]QIE45515.1 TRAP transporter substrate-binding protein [Pseudohalocynthiibacter aestuariivivens]UXX82567.1 TRAP transporter substrate-binding protein [Roseovarius pelagicus]
MKTFTTLAALAMGAVFGTVGVAQETKFRANMPGNEESIAYKSVERFDEVLQDLTDGNVALRLFANSALGDQESSLEALQTGLLDMATVETPITSVVPELGATALPYIFSSREHIAAAMDGEAGERIREMLAEKGLYVVAFLEGGFRQITNNVRPIVTPADLDGVKMRTPGSALRIKIFNHYGANASPLPFSELYSALQTGVYDGQENPVIWAKSQKFYEVQDYLSLTNHLYTVTYLLISKDKFDALSEEQQAAMIKAGDAAEAYSVELGMQADTEIVDHLKDQGMQVNEADIPAFTDASGAIWTEWAAEQGAKAQELIDLIVAARPAQ